MYEELSQVLNEIDAYFRKRNKNRDPLPAAIIFADGSGRIAAWIKGERQEFLQFERFNIRGAWNTWKEIQGYIVSTWLGESGQVNYLVNPNAPDGEQPAIVDSCTHTDIKETCRVCSYRRKSK